MLSRHVIDIDNTREPSTLNPTMRLYSTEDVPAVVTVALVARETEGDEERFYGFGAVAIPYQFPVASSTESGCESKKRKETYRRMYRASYGAGAPGLNESSI